jgi:predicted transcriptional regulator of viral defense system
VTARIAERQHGVVARRQLLELGMGRRAIENRLARGRLYAVHRGVYAVGHRRLTAHERWMATVLAHGASAVLSHRSAASLWGLMRSTRSTIEVTAARRWSRAGVAVHRSSLQPDEITVLNGIPVTSVPRTIFDLASVLSRRGVERAIEEAEARRLTDPLSVRDLLARHPNRPGGAKLRAVLAGVASAPTPTRSELEDRSWSSSTPRGFRDRRPTQASTSTDAGWSATACGAHAG